ncbi:MAG: ergothioneine biosynthesis protein EgtB [Acidimicrobiia bacterium]|nr:ergothioneine biosynthesis protein EgtB [Acidimicrobiia bacterium]
MTGPGGTVLSRTGYRVSTGRTAEARPARRLSTGEDHVSTATEQAVAEDHRNSAPAGASGASAPAGAAGATGVGGAGAGDYGAVRALTEALAAPLSPEDQVIQSMPDASPAKWHRAHSTWFFETFLLRPHARGYVPLDERYAYLFNSYYEAAGPRHPRPQRGLVTRPGVAEVGEYRAHVDAAMGDLLARAGGPLAVPVADLVTLGLNHEQQHQELLLMDIKHAFSLNPLDPLYRPRRPPRSGPRLAGDSLAATSLAGPGWHEHAGGLEEVGHGGHGFAYDNEGPRHTVYLRPFALAETVVTCGDWLAFMEDGGYRRAELWLSDGWATVQGEAWDAPSYWRREERDWSQFTLAGRQQVDPAEPVCHVSYYEADAFARWSGARLPTEAEWEVVAAGAQPQPQPGAQGALDLEVLHPRPAPAGAGMRQLFGDVWEWTSSAYLPYPGFRPAEGAVGEYNGKFMVNQQVLRGGCCATPAGHVRASYRNFFPPSARWPFTGLRLARDL